MKRILSLATATGLIFLAGCGGSGSSSNGSPNPSVTLTSSVAQVSYGQPVTISWHSSNADTVQSNFGAGSSQINGSFTDTPAADATYSITVSNSGALGGSTPATATVTVHVVKGTKRILAIADNTKPETATVIQFLQSITTVPVTVSLTLPSSFSADVLVFGNGTYSPADWPKVTSFLSAGGGVVLVGAATQKLATGDTTNGNISAIGNVLAGATQIGTDTLEGSTVVSTAQPGFTLSATVYGVSGLPDYNHVSPVSISAIRLTTASSSNGYGAFAYSPPSGGRIAYLSDVLIDNSPSSVATSVLLDAECRWVSP